MDNPRSTPPSGEEDITSSQANRRISGRAKRKPELFSTGNYSGIQLSAKRKRASQHDEGDESDASDEVEDEIEEEDEIEDESDGEADEEELREQRRAARKKKAQRPKADKQAKARRTAKKPKISNGVATELALRPAGVNGKPRAKPKKARVRQSGLTEEDGLYAEVFGRGHTTDAVAAEWLTQYEQHNINAMADLVNFVLRCTGTDLKVTVHDIQDVDNVANRLNDLQEEYQSENITDYPLISKAKKFRSFGSTVAGFFESLMRTLHSSSVLYNDSALIENIQVWVSSMSSAPIRPFRHTATAISLEIVTTLCNVAREVTSTVSNSRKQLEAEKKKKSVNKGRVATMQSKVEEGEKRLEVIDEVLRDAFDTVFVHRYRDVDPRIRAECMTALGIWINTYREMFFEGQYLRYLGWVLSDTVANTRTVVVNQLHRLFQNKDNISGLRAFTERFRPRIVEMATRDAEPGVRASAVELLDLIRDAGLLEPDDIDAVGRLVFDTEAKVRKAAGKFFVANIQDVYDNLTEGMEEELSESFPEEDDDEDFETAKRSWIKFKCLADILQVYDGQESDLRADQEPSVSRTGLIGGRVDSRFVLATESVYPHLEELHHWESLAGYLLYDHSQIPGATAGQDPATSVKQLYRLDEGQEGILLEVLGCAVKLHIMDVGKSDVDKRGRRTKVLQERMEAEQESTAHNLSQIIPRLLNKFGSVPEAASAILRLEHLVDLNLIQDLQKDATAYSDLIANINRQFLTHSHQGVLAEATVAFLHARTSDELKEAMESKVQELWDDTLDALRSLSATKEKSDSQNFSANALTSLSNTVMRISNLASVSDCTSILEATPSTGGSRKSKSQSRSAAAVDVLLDLAERGLREVESDDETEQLEKDLVINVFKSVLVYFMWKVRAITDALSTEGPNFESEFFESLSSRRDTFVATLTAILQQRRGIDDIKIIATTTLLDVQTVFGTLRHAGNRGNNMMPIMEDDIASQVQGLIQEVFPETRALISRIHDATERAFAKKSRRKLDPADDDEPMGSQSDIESIPSDDEEDPDDDEETLVSHRARAVLLAEQRLCELTGKIVLAIIGRVLDASGPGSGKLRQKLLRNRTKLGQNYKEVIAYLDEGKTAANKRRIVPSKGKAAATANGNVQGKPAAQRAVNGKSGGKAKSTERVEDEDDEDEDEGERVPEEEDEDEDLRARGLMDEDEVEAAGNDDNDDAELSPPPDDIMGD